MTRKMPPNQGLPRSSRGRPPKFRPVFESKDEAQAAHIRALAAHLGCDVEEVVPKLIEMILAGVEVKGLEKVIDKDFVLNRLLYLAERAPRDSTRTKALAEIAKIQGFYNESNTVQQINVDWNETRAQRERAPKLTDLTRAQRLQHATGEEDEVKQPAEPGQDENDQV